MSTRSSRPLVVGGIWLAFFTLWAVVALSTHDAPTASWWPTIAVNAPLCIPWTVFTLSITALHSWARARRLPWRPLAALHVALFTIVALADAVMLRWLITIVSHAPVTIPFAATVIYYADFDVVRYVAVVVLAEASIARAAVLARQRLTARLEALLSRARLDYLEAQLQPHFLFNALGAVSELAFRAPPTAVRIVEQLAFIVRDATSTQADEVTLGEELDLIEPYLDIQRVRFADWLEIQYDVEAPALNCLVPRFVLQPLVENAIHHGLEHRRAAGTIRIGARVAGNELLIEVDDDGAGLRAHSSPRGRGIGLSNVRERVAILYDAPSESAASRLRLRGNAMGGAVAELVLPARRASGAPANGVPSSGPSGSPSGEAPVFADDQPRVGERPLTARGVAARAIAIWTACGLLWAQLSVTYLELRGRMARGAWLAAAGADMTNALLWAALTPLVFALVRRFPLQAPRRGRAAMAYAVAALGAPILHTWALAAVTNRGASIWSPAYEMTLVVDFAIALVLIGIACRRHLLDWLRAREEAAAALSEEFVSTRVRAAGLRSISPVLLERLADVAAQIPVDPLAAERTLARLGDTLRAAMDGLDESPGDWGDRLVARAT